jgi:hypothetical protein
MQAAAVVIIAAVALAWLGCWWKCSRFHCCNVGMYSCSVTLQINGELKSARTCQQHGTHASSLFKSNVHDKRLVKLRQKHLCYQNGSFKPSVCHTRSHWLHLAPAVTCQQPAVDMLQLDANPSCLHPSVSLSARKIRYHLRGRCASIEVAIQALRLHLLQYMIRSLVSLLFFVGGYAVMFETIVIVNNVAFGGGSCRFPAVIPP